MSSFCNGNGRLYNSEGIYEPFFITMDILAPNLKIEGIYHALFP